MNENEFYIPANYLDSGYILNGRFAKRNALEAVILGIAGFFTLRLFGVPCTIDNISIYIFVICPLMLVGASGIQGDPVSEYMLNAYRWLRHRIPYIYNPHVTAYRYSPAQLVLDQPNLRDVLSNKINGMRNNMSSKKTNFQEGVNFEFASDPEVEALREAEERYLREEEERHAEEANLSHNETGALTDVGSGLNVADIADGILLPDYEE